jgi:hypothetical protein
LKIFRILKRTLKQRRSTSLPLPPSRFVAAPTRIPREQRKVDKKNKGEKGPEYVVIGKVVYEEIKVVGAREEDEVLSTE